MGGVQIIDAMVITPRIVGRSVGLAPLEVILTMMAAGSLFGFLGVLLAVPLGAVAKILVARAPKAYLASEFYRRPADAQPAHRRAPRALAERALIDLDRVARLQRDVGLRPSAIASTLTIAVTFFPPPTRRVSTT